MSATFALRAMKPADLERVSELWQTTPGVCLSRADAPERLRRFLARNPGLSQVATAPDGAIVGAALCGHDGRRGCLYHVAVAPRFRRHGVASAIVARSLGLLAAQGIERCTILVLADNHAGRTFWARRGWRRREDLRVLQQDTGSPTAEDDACVAPRCP